MPQGKGTYGSKKGRPPKKMNMGGMTINKRTLDKMTPAQLGSDTMSQYFTSKVDESKGRRRPGMKKGGVAVKKMNMGGMTINKRTLDKMTPAQLGSDTMSQYFTSKVDESKGGPRRPGMKKGGAAVKKMRYGGETRPMGSDPKPMLPKRPRPMPQESRVRVRPGMKKGGTVAMPKMMARGGALAKAARKELGVGSVGKEVMKKLGLTKGAVSDRELDKITKRFTMDIVSKTKGAISDREMDIFLKSSPNLQKKSSPKKKKPIRRGKPGYNRK